MKCQVEGCARRATARISVHGSATTYAVEVCRSHRALDGLPAATDRLPLDVELEEVPS